jgi:hypothetical protein
MKYYNQTPTLTRLYKLKNVSKQYIPNLNYRDIATISLRAYYAYAKRGYKIAIVTIEDIDEALR